MRLHRLSLLNFRQHASTAIEFGPGITAIIGPNGAGKTTLLEAIAWAFYGTPAARGTRDTIRWNRAQARASVRVEVEFGLGAHEFKVGRGLYNAELFQDRFEAPVVVGHQEVSARIERLLGMTRDEFFNTYFTGQKELAVMASLPPAERAQFLSRVLGYEKLRLAQDRLRETRSGLRGELAGLEQGLADPEELERERADAEATLTTVRAALRQAENDRERAREELERLDRNGRGWSRCARRRSSSRASCESPTVTSTKHVGNSSGSTKRWQMPLPRSRSLLAFGGTSTRWSRSAPSSIGSRRRRVGQVSADRFWDSSRSSTSSSNGSSSGRSGWGM